MAEFLDFYSEKKFCTTCRQYVPYLASIQRSYCALCGQPVNLFSREDWQKFKTAQNLANPAKKTPVLVSKKTRSVARDR
ncbi:MAG: hypothetical protein ACKVS6_10680 [Planctomycetota bacterium]